MISPPRRSFLNVRLGERETTGSKPLRDENLEQLEVTNRHRLQDLAGKL